MGRPLDLKVERFEGELSDAQFWRMKKIADEVREMASLLERPYGFPRRLSPLRKPRGYNGK
ncbi:MAG: hypothetical protein AABX07_02690 [Nanoarchaeota archaeon]